MSTTIIEPTEIDNIVAASRRYEATAGALVTAERELAIAKEGLAKKEQIAADARREHEKSATNIRTLAKRVS